MLSLRNALESKKSAWLRLGSDANSAAKPKACKVTGSATPVGVRRPNAPFPICIVMTNSASGSSRPSMFVVITRAPGKALPAIA